MTLDLGSSELKVVIYDEDGNCLSSVTSEVGGVEAQGCRADLNPERMWRSVRDGISAVHKSCHSTLRAAAISSHGESFVPLDRNGQAVGNILPNIDSRAGAEMKEFADAFGKGSLYRQTGLTPHPMYTLPKIAWIKKNQPAVFRQAANFGCMEDYILQRLGIERVIDSSLASRTLGLDIHRNQWAEELLRFAGITPGQLSRVEPSGTPIGVAASGVAEELGLPPGVVWCTGGHDQACTSIGAGAQELGTLADGTGTFECISAPLETPLLTEASLDANLPCERHALAGQFLTLAYVPGGISLKWLRDNCYRERATQAIAEGKSAYDCMLADVPDSPTGLFFFPYLLGTGTPWLESETRSTIWGLSSSTTNQQLIKAALEGMSFERRWNLEILKSLGVHQNRILAVGGGAKSELLLQLKADIFQCPVVAVPGEASSRGATICAGMGVNAYGNWKEAIAAMVKPGRVFEPRPASTRQYQELFEQYHALAPRLYGHRLWPGRPNSTKGSRI